VAAITRGEQFAKELARGEKKRFPVPVERIALKYAIVVREDLPSDVSGMLVPLPLVQGNRKWAIVVNKQDAPVRQRFTIAHELGHLLIHKYPTPHADGRLQVRFRDEKSAAGSVREEIEANQFAAELLMPERYVRTWAKKQEFDVADQLVDAAAMRGLTQLANKLKVSVQALSFRIANLGLS
jgi:Zn-dependent peptidase ImmA (M78 family)